MTSNKEFPVLIKNIGVVGVRTDKEKKKEDTDISIGHMFSAPFFLFVCANAKGTHLILEILLTILNFLHFIFFPLLKTIRQS